MFTFIVFIKCFLKKVLYCRIKILIYLVTIYKIFCLVNLHFWHITNVLSICSPLNVYLMYINIFFLLHSSVLRLGSKKFYYVPKNNIKNTRIVSPVNKTLSFLMKFCFMVCQGLRGKCTQKKYICMYTVQYVY